MYRVHPSSPTAWSRKYLPDGSSKSSDRPDQHVRCSAWLRTEAPRCGQLQGCPSRSGRMPLGGLSDLTSESPRGIHHGQKCRCRHLSSLCSFFFVVIAGLTVRARITWCQDRQYVLVNGASTGPSRTVYRLNGLGRRDLDPGLLGGSASVARLTTRHLRQRPRHLPARPGPLPAVCGRESFMSDGLVNIPTMPTDGLNLSAGFIPPSRT